MPGRVPARRLLSSVLLAAVLLGVAASPSGGQSADVDQQLDEVKAALKDVKADAGEIGKALDKATAALEQAERELADAQLLRLSAHARAVQAKRRLDDAKERIEQLQVILAQRARGIYMSGSPVSLSALASSGEGDDLLSQMAMLDHLAEQGNDSLADLVVARKDYSAAIAALKEAEAEAKAAAEVIRKKIDQAEKLRDARLAAKEKLDDRIRELEGEAAVLRRTQELAAQRLAGTQRAGGTCDLSGTSEAEYFIIMKESGGDPTARNPRSTAFGLGQLLLDLRVRILGADEAWTVDCGRQLFAFRTYVKERYGTAENAKAFWLSHGWY